MVTIPIFGEFSIRRCERCVAVETEDDPPKSNTSTDSDSLELERRKHLRRLGVPERFLSADLKTMDMSKAGHAEAVAAAREVLEHADAPGLIAIGPPGTGKTHLVCAMIRHVRMSKSGHPSALYTTAQRLFRAVKESWRPNAPSVESRILDDHLRPHLLVLDEIGVQFGSETERLILTEIINDRYADMKKTVLASNASLLELKTLLGERILDRFREGGRVVIVSGPSRRIQAQP